MIHRFIIRFDSIPMNPVTSESSQTKLLRNIAKQNAENAPKLYRCALLVCRQI